MDAVGSQTNVFLLVNIHRTERDWERYLKMLLRSLAARVALRRNFFNTPNLLMMRI